MRVITINLQKEMDDLKRILTKKHLFYANFCFPRTSCYAILQGEEFLFHRIVIELGFMFIHEIIEFVSILFTENLGIKDENIFDQ